MLFLIYTYDLPKKLSEIGVTCKMYADDLKIYRIVENDSDCDVIQKAVSYVECWASHWNLPLNAEKTTVLTIGKVNHDRVYQLGHTRLSKVQNVRDLGYFFFERSKFYRALQNAGQKGFVSYVQHFQST